LTPLKPEGATTAKSGVLWKRVLGHVAEILPKGASERQLAAVSNSPYTFSAIAVSEC